MGGKVTTAPFENKYEEYWGTLAWKVIMSFGDDAYQVKEKKLNDAFVTANCAYSRKLLKRIKGFDLWFANNAEDVDPCWRALEHKAKLMYIPSVVIKAHSVTTLKGIKQKSFRNGVSSSKLQKRYGKWFNYDVIIIGAGPAGLTCGLQLAKAGKSCLVIEQREELRGKVCGDGLSSHCMQVLKKINIQEDELVSLGGKKVYRNITSNFGQLEQRYYCKSKEYENYAFGLSRDVFFPAFIMIDNRKGH